MGKPHASGDLHGNVPDNCEVALLLVDVINDLEFEGGDQLLEHAEPAAAELAKLKQRAVRAGVPVIYANDNFGRWRSDFFAQVRHVCEDHTRGEAIAKLLSPTDEDYFVLKPRHSAFYETCLGLLLEHLGVRTLLIGGFATDSCVQLTANDAYLRGFGVLILSDGTATQTEEAQAMSLAQMRRVLHAQTQRCSELSFEQGERGATVKVPK